MSVKRTIHRAIRAIMPYGVIALHRRLKNQKREPETEHENPRFMPAFWDYLNRSNYVQLLDKCPFKQVVSVQGFGYSGSGAVVDLLREYEGNMVVGFVDKEGSLVDETQVLSYEVDILRLAGGLLEFEKYLGCNNLFQNDALLHRFVALVEHSDLYILVPQVRPYFHEFFRNITDLYHRDKIIGRHNNPHLDYNGNNEILFFKEMTVSDYRLLCRKLLYSLFNIYKADSNCDTLVLDQFIGDFEFDMARNLEYVPELKMITVYRDPRDVYTFARRVNEEWIAHGDAQLFVDWYKRIMACYDIHENKKYLVVRFEDLVNDYENTVAKIENYLQLDTFNHKHIKSAFDPSVSARNVGVWREEKGMDKDYEYINNQLNVICYNGI